MNILHSLAFDKSLIITWRRAKMRDGAGPTHEVMMVAAHGGDLLAARATGMKTCLVHRLLEYGPGGLPEPQPDPPFDVVADDFLDLAAKLRT